MLAKVLDNLVQVINKECLELIPISNNKETEREFELKYERIKRLKLVAHDLELELDHE